MQKTLTFPVLGLACFCLFVCTVFPQVEMQTNLWTGNDFDQMGGDVARGNDTNFLTFPGAKRVRQDGIDYPELLTDGLVGSYGDHGRVHVDGKPSRLVYYLGKPRTIREIALYTGNGDQRANQDFEIRLVDNAANPGQEPAFPAEPTFTSGDKVIGNNGGGYKTSFLDKSGKALLDGRKFDWIEFKLWRTYPARVGEPGKSAGRASDWASYVEIQLLGDPNDPNLFDSESEKQTWLRKREKERLAQTILDTFGDDVVYALKNPESLRRAIEDLARRFPDDYAGEAFLARYTTVVTTLDAAKPDPSDAGAFDGAGYIDAIKGFAALRREALLANPLLNFQSLLYRKAQNPGLTANWISNCARGKGGYGNTLQTVDPRKASEESMLVAEAPNGSFIGDINLHWDADKILVTALADDKTWQVFELQTDGTGLRQITPSMGPDVDNAEGCYVPDGSFVFVSTANMMGVPCIDGSSPVGNIYRVESDNKTVRQLTFEQDQDWCPILLPNGRIMYLRWEYTDTAHYFTRILFSMNPDGTNQVEHYGSGSFWPNSLFYAKPVPDHSSKFVGIVSGHHGVSREGELVVFDPRISRKEAEGVVQRIPGFGEKVEPVIMDQLVDRSWPKFLFPYPLNENYYLVSCRLTPSSPWGLYLVDVFDNMLKLREDRGFHLLEPTPLVKRPKPPVIPSRIDPTDATATAFITDAYFGEGLKNVPSGSVKKMRIFAYSFGYRGIGGHDVFGMESCWDARRMIGEVPVYEDGSAMFTIPANTPIAIQPLDADGKAMQIMRSWLVGMPGEVVSCAGCHESQNSVSPSKSSIARTKRVAPIEPFLGPERPFNFENEVQPMLDRYCAGCHDGEGDRAHLPNFKDNAPGPMTFSKSYHALARYVRRPGPESDVYMFNPMEYHASTSELIVRLEKGHHSVQIDKDSLRKLYAWVDLNVPYYGTWQEVADRLRNKGDETRKYAERHNDLKKLYANVDLDFEAESFLGFDAKERPAFEEPPKAPKPDRSAPTVANWPFDADAARKMQSATEAGPIQTVKIDDLSFDLALIPAGSFVMGDEKGFRDELPRKQTTITKPFRMFTTEVTNALYAKFDAKHDSRYIDQWWKDHTTAGYPANGPQQPVIRISWNEANAFCAWLSKQTGRKFRLPTEAEWEWACRAGTATPMWYGECDVDFGTFENLSDETTRKFVVMGVNPQPVGHADWQAFIPRAEKINDGQMIAEKLAAYSANPWGLFDMHGSVSEFTATTIGDGRVVVKGGSWRDRPQMARSGIKRYFQPWQKVFNVGIRPVCDE